MLSNLFLTFTWYKLASLFASLVGEISSKLCEPMWFLFQCKVCATVLMQIYWLRAGPFRWEQYRSSWAAFSWPFWYCSQPSNNFFCSCNRGCQLVLFSGACFLLPPAETSLGHGLGAAAWYLSWQALRLKIPLWVSLALKKGRNEIKNLNI